MPLAADADPLVARARLRETAGDEKAAAALYRQWLALNPGAEGCAAVFGSYFRVEQDFSALLAASVSFLASAAGRPGAGAQFASIARLLDCSGRIEQARDAYLQAYAEGAAVNNLVSAFLLSLEMNDAATMSACLSKSTGKTGSEELLLQALSALQAGTYASAKNTLVGLADQIGDPDLAVRALWVLSEVAAESGDASGQAAIGKRLASRYPGAPESVIAAGSAGGSAQAAVTLAPGPGLLPSNAPPSASGQVSGSQGAASDTAPPPGSSTSNAAKRYSVQVGSFGVKDNADDLVAQLAKHGFSAVIVHDAPQGKDRYRVFAATGLTAADAKAALARLAEAGYSGFLVAE